MLKKKSNVPDTIVISFFLNSDIFLEMKVMKETSHLDYTLLLQCNKA